MISKLWSMQSPDNREPSLLTSGVEEVGSKVSSWARTCLESGYRLLLPEVSGLLGVGFQGYSLGVGF